MTKWTKEQLSAIDEKDCDLLVAAAAGAGKTAVLVERIIKKVIRDEDPIDIDNMLVVTFTNAAASEMRERIAMALDKAIEENPRSQRLQRQLLLLPKAGITTIHSFCMDVLKNNYTRLDLTPDFRVADETESTLLKIEGIEELFDMQYEEGSELFFKLLDSYSGNRDDNKLKDMVLEIYSFVRSTPWPDKWLKEMTKAYDLAEDFDFIKTPWAKVILDFVDIELFGCLNTLNKAYEIAMMGYGLEKCAIQLSDDIENVKSLLYFEGRSWDSLYEAFGDIKFSTQRQPTKDGDKDSYEILKELRKNTKEKIYKLRDEFFDSDSSGIISDLNTLHPLIEYLCQLVMNFDKLYTDMKKEKGLIDFNDLEHFSLKILTKEDDNGEIVPSSAALSLRDKYSEIMIDEYQDSNMVQEVILNIISKREIGSPNMFMVGDVKQSIYRFRQAKPELFLDKYERYSEDSGNKDRKVMLYKNFRSRQEIINGVNCLFKQLMTKYVGEIQYNNDEYLNYGAFYPKDEEEVPYNLELHILDLFKEEELLVGEENQDTGDEIEDSIEKEDEIEDELEDIQAEARIVGHRILDLVGKGASNPLRIYDKELKGYRNADFKDIVILLRTVRNWADTFEEELGAMGVPIFADTGTGYFKRIEVQIILSLLQIIDNPLQDIPLLAVLKSPIGGFSSQELLDIRQIDRNISFYEAITFAGKKDDDMGRKVSTFLSRLEAWREKALHMPTDQLIWYLYNDTGYMSYVSAMPEGHQRRENLKILFERAKKYEDTSFKGLFNFINFIEKIKSGSGDMGNAKILGEGDNVVRIMSIHKSKGLEFPVVILGGVGKGFNMQDTRKAVLLHHEMGFGADLVDVDKRITYATLPKKALKHKIKMETLSEEMRILYVGMTRAKEKLIITGFDRNITKTVKGWLGALDYDKEKLPAHMVLQGNKYLSWIGLALIRHGKMKVLREQAELGGLSNNNLLADNSSWDLKIWKKAELLKEKQIEKESTNLREALENIKKDKGFGTFAEEIDKKLNWTYPYEKSTLLPVKLSVTELKRLKTEEDDYAKELYSSLDIKKPVFLEEERTMSAAKRGSIMHFIMQHLDLRNVSNIDGIKTQVEQMVVQEFLTIEEAKAADTNRIYEFFKSDLGERLLSAEKVFREKAFNIEISPGEVYPDQDYKDMDDKILLQGIIDCYFFEDDEIILLDYKTDYIDNNEKEKAEAYKIQIDYYTKALKTILGKNVKERYIYFFHSGNGVRVW